MCDFENYEDAIKHYLPFVTYVDGKDMALQSNINMRSGE